MVSGIVTLALHTREKGNIALIIRELRMNSEFLVRARLMLCFTLLLFSGLALAESEPLDPTWVRPDTDFSKYTKFLVKPLNISDVKIVRPPWAHDDPIEWTLETIDSATIQAIFLDAMNEVLESDDGYPVVYSPGDDVLEVTVEILSIMPYVRPGSEGKDDGHEITTLGSGEITGAAELRDSQTRALLVLLEGERVVGQEYKQWTPENNAANLRDMFEDFAKRLRTALDRVHGN